MLPQPPSQRRQPGTGGCVASAVPIGQTSFKRYEVARDEPGAGRPPVPWGEQR